MGWILRVATRDFRQPRLGRESESHGPNFLAPWITNNLTLERGKYDIREKDRNKRNWQTYF